MKQLADSIKKRGVLQPISVRVIKNGQFEIISGERRFRAAQMVGLVHIPAYVLEISNDSEMMEYALIENIQRVDLNPIEEAEGYAILSGKYGLTHAKISECVSKSRIEVSNKLRLLNLPPTVKNSLRYGDIEYGHARALLRLRESKKIIKIFKVIINKKLTVRQTEALIKNVIQGNDRKNGVIKHKSSLYAQTENDLSKYLNTKTVIQKKKKGEIIIEFLNDDELKKIVKKMKNKFFI